jgi:predicted NUDIX family NTP pyrophosphohydrolase
MASAITTLTRNPIFATDPSPTFLMARVYQDAGLRSTLSAILLSMTKRSAGSLLYRRTPAGPEVFLIHPGGPFWSKKDAWSIPKGEYPESEPPLEAARREFQEETGSHLTLNLPETAFAPLGVIRQPAGKEVMAWAVEGDFDPATLVSNTCLVEWPPRSGRQIEIPEADRGAWFDLATARAKIFRGQELFLDRLAESL